MTDLFRADQIEERPAPKLDAAPLFVAIAYYSPSKRWAQKGRLRLTRESAARDLDALGPCWVHRRIYRLGEDRDGGKGEAAP